MDKKTNIDLCKYIENKTGFSKKNIELFVDAFTTVLTEMVKEKGNVEINNLGTFKTVKMAQRESINVNNGERITIPEYSKITFVSAYGNISNKLASVNYDEKSDKTLSETKVSNQTDESNLYGMDEELESNTDSNSNVVVKEEEFNANQEAEPVLEKPVDEFSGIDVLISTPESLQDIKIRLEEAKKQREQADAELEKAQNDFELAKVKLQKAQEEKNSADANVEQLSTTLGNVLHHKPAVVDAVMDAPTNSEDESQDNTVSVLTTDTQIRKHADKKKYLLSAAAVVSAIILVFLFANILKNNNENVKPVQIESQNLNDSVTNLNNNTISQNADNANNGKQNATEAKVEKVLFDGKTPFEIIVTKHYGGRKHMKEVLDYNIEKGAFSDWRHIPKGTEILLPKFNE